MHHRSKTTARRPDAGPPDVRGDLAGARGGGPAGAVPAVLADLHGACRAHPAARGRAGPRRKATRPQPDPRSRMTELVLSRAAPRGRRAPESRMRRAGARPARGRGRPAGRVTARHLTAARHRQARRARGPKRAAAENARAFSGAATEGSEAHSRGTRRAPCPHRRPFAAPASTARDGRDALGPTWTAGSTARRAPAGAAPPSVDDRWALVACVRPSPSRAARGQRTAQSRLRRAARRASRMHRRQRARRPSGRLSRRASLVLAFLPLRIAQKGSILLARVDSIRRIEQTPDSDPDAYGAPNRAPVDIQFGTLEQGD